ncbi:MAG TPA: hypothetical protein VGN34_21290 [Ktedonobacteraceae bacterium]
MHHTSFAIPYRGCPLARRLPSPPSLSQGCPPIVTHVEAISVPFAAGGHIMLFLYHSACTSLPLCPLSPTKTQGQVLRSSWG